MISPLTGVPASAVGLQACGPSGENGSALRVAPGADPGLTVRTPSVGSHFRQAFGLSGDVGSLPTVHQPGFLDAIADGGLDDDVEAKHRRNEAGDAKRGVPKKKPSEFDLKGVHGDSSSPATVRQRRSNLDLNGKLVRKGLVVSYGGLRFKVNKVNRGACYGETLVHHDRMAAFCELVVVVTV